MKYNQPYGVSDPNAPYINGNPSTGTMGSIPPAASIEHPQREIVNFIRDSGFAETDADLAQLSKAVQSGHVIYGVDAGPASNTILITLPRAPDAPLKAGLQVNIRLANEITGPTTINVNGIGAVPAVHGDGTELRKGDGVPGQMLCFLYDGTKFQAVGGVSSLGDNVSGIRTKLTGNLTLYICTTGSDVTGDGSFEKPWRTRQFAWYRAQAIFDLVYTYTLTFQLCDGTYTDAFLASGFFVGATGPASIIFQGNMANPALCVIDNVSVAWTAQNSAQYRIQGFTSRGQQRYAVLATIYGWISIGPNNVFGICQDAHLAANVAGTVQIDNSYTVIGGAQQHFLASTGSFLFIQGNPVVVTLIGTLNFPTAFALCINGAQISLPGSQLSFSGAATGVRYSAVMCGCIGTNGAGESFLPGSLPGNKFTGGQYA